MPDGVPGAQAASAFLLWATAVKACGSEVTRDCVFDQIASIDGWTGGGLHAPTKPGSNLPPECGVTVKMQGGTYVRFDPKETGQYDCDPDYVRPVTGEIVRGLVLSGTTPYPIAPFRSARLAGLADHVAATLHG